MKSESAPQSPPTVSKKPRALPCVWMRFWHLDNESYFFLGKTRMIKIGLFSARKYGSVEHKLVAPWTRVKTTRLVRRERSAQETVDQLNKRLKNPLSHEFRKELGLTRPYTKEELERTPPPPACPIHPAYRSAPIMPTAENAVTVVDDCQGGNLELARQIRPRVEQPNSDNNVIGPTS